MASTINATGHGLSAGSTFQFANVDPSGTGVVEGQTYYVLASGLTADAFQFSDTDGGSAITLEAAITACDLLAVGTYEVVSDGVMDPPVAPDAPDDLEVTSVVHDNVVVLRITAPSAAVPTGRSIQFQVTKAVPAEAGIAEVRSASGNIGAGSNYDLGAAPTDGNLLLLATNSSQLPTGWTVLLGGQFVDFGAGQAGFYLAYRVASSDTGTWSAPQNAQYVIAEFSGVTSTVLDYDFTNRHASDNARMSGPTLTPAGSNDVLVIGQVIRDNIGANSLTPDAGYTETQRYDHVANGWSLQMIHLTETNNGSYDPGTTPNPVFSGGWGYAGIVFEGETPDPPDWDKAMEHTLVETSDDQLFDIPCLGETRYALRHRKQDVYGNYSDWSTVTYHTTLAGSDSLVARTLETLGANDQILMADDTQDVGYKFVGSQTPTTVASGDAAAEGTADTYSRGDHKHGIPALPSAAADYLVGTAQGSLSGEIVVGTTPGGELGGTWGSPTIDATHSGSAHTDFIAKAFFDAKGDLISASAADTPVLLAVGTDGFVLSADSTTASGLKWVAPGAGSGDVATDAIWDAKGDIAAGTGANTADNLPVGANDTILMADSGQTTGLKWVAAGTPATIGTANAEGTGDSFTRGDHVHAHEAAHINHDTTWAAKGDLIVGTANDTAAVLTVGANDTIPMADSGETTGIKWVASGTPAAIDATGGGGSADTFARGDHTHLHEAAHIAHDTIWAAAGDIVVATGNDAASVLSKGNAGAVLAMLNGALAWNAGTSFPGSPATGDRYFRTDLRLEFFYDGTRWLSTELFTANSDMWTPNATYTVTLSASQTFAHRLTFLDTVTGGSDVWLEDVILWGFIASGGSALSASHKWVATVQKNALANTNSSLGTIAFDSGSSNTWRRGTLSVDALLAIPGTNTGLVIDWAKTGTPGNLTITNPAQASYRIVAT